jgi:hypothetical protein
LDGSSGKITIPYSSSLNPPEVTIEAWVKPDFSGRPLVGADVDTVFSNVIAGVAGYGLFLTQDPGYLYGDAPGPLPQGTLALDGWFPDLATIYSSTPVPNDGSYHHVAGTYDGTSLKLYIDGMLSGSTSASGTIQPGGAASIGFTDAYVTRYSVSVRPTASGPCAGDQE